MDHIYDSEGKPKALFVLAHGAGAGMRHPFMGSVSELICNQGIAVFRYEFTYIAEGRRRPDPPRRLEARVREAVSEGPSIFSISISQCSLCRGRVISSRK